AVTFHRAAHAAGAAAATTQFFTRNGEHCDAGLVIFLVGVGVALIPHHHARTHCQHVVGIVPLFAFGFEAVTTRGDELELIHAQRFFNGGNKVTLFLDVHA